MEDNLTAKINMDLQTTREIHAMHQIKSKLSRVVIVPLVVIALFPLNAAAQVFPIFNFDAPVDTSNSPGPVPNKWYIDRWAPHAFENAVFDAGSRLHVRIDTLDAVKYRPSAGGSKSSFYNVQGRRYDLNIGIDNSITADLYIPASWVTSHRRANMWARAVDSLSPGNQESSARYMEFGFANLDGNTPRIQAFDPSTGFTFIAIPGGFAYDAWHTFRSEYTSSAFKYYLDGTLVYSANGPLGTNKMTTMFIQGYNFGDSTLTAPYSYALESYDVYWDNVAAQPGVTLPIQLASFAAAFVDLHNVRLDWATLTETNNYGFEVQRKGLNESDFSTMPNSFVPGHGTTLQPQQYSFTDASVTAGLWLYRLEQIDLDGTVHFSDPVQVDVLTGVKEKSHPATFALEQNYPNPFNPSTVVSYQLPVVSGQSPVVSLKVFDILGREVAVLVNERQGPGSYSVRFNANGLASGVYLYRLTAGAFTETKTLTLVK